MYPTLQCSLGYVLKCLSMAMVSPGSNGRSSYEGENHSFASADEVIQLAINPATISLLFMKEEFEKGYDQGDGSLACVRFRIVCRD